VPLDIRPQLLRAYVETRYVAGPAVARVGRRCESMDALLARLGIRQAIFVTAWNPLSRRMASGWNRRMQQRLAGRLRRFRMMPADGAWRGWHEAHLLVAADPRVVVVLARRFRQRAVVVVQRGRAARLLLLRRLIRA
jgi:Protein of unknown function (DUF3293)